MNNYRIKFVFANGQVILSEAFNGKAYCYTKAQKYALSNTSYRVETDGYGPVWINPAHVGAIFVEEA
jgi:hypothetical protein